MNADQKNENLFQVIPNSKLCFFDKADLEAWMKNIRVASQVELGQQAQKYIINRPKR